MRQSDDFWVTFGWRNFQVEYSKLLSNYFCCRE